jgi:LTXXQ motif family protein
MQNLHRLMTFGAMLAAIGGGAVVAQPAAPGGAFMHGPGGMGPGMMGRGPGPWVNGTDAASYLDRLKADLGITTAQEPAWKDYADTVQGVAGQMQGVHQTMYDAMGTASWQERRDMMNRMFQARQQSFDAVHEAAEKLLPALNPAQQAKAARALPGLAVRGPGMMGHWAR